MAHSSQMMRQTQRSPIPTDVLVTIQHECTQSDDEPRWLIALIADTGMRLSEACGLLTSDIRIGW